MAELSGVWLFKETISSSSQQTVDVNFKSNGAEYTQMCTGSSSMAWVVYYAPATPHGVVGYDRTRSPGWCINSADYKTYTNAPELRTVDFGETPQTVTATFYSWFTARATKQETHTHSYTETVTTPATCTTEGVKTYTCECGDTYTEAIPVIAHSYMDGYCTNCGTADPDYVPPVGKYYYNGVLLPEIPSDALGNYPYCWIRNNTRTGYYDLFMAKSPWWQSDSTTIYTASYADGIQWYRTSISAVGDDWTFNQSWTTNGGMANEPDRAILWANHNIPTGAVTATAIYFVGSSAVPDEESYQIKKDTVVAIADQVRRFYNTEETMTPAQMKAKLEAADGIYIVVATVNDLPSNSPNGTVAIVEG